MKIEKNAAVYIRVSKGDPERQKSTKEQLEEIAEFAEGQNIKVLTELTYVDEGKTGRSLETRPMMQQLLKDVEGHKFEQRDVSLLIYYSNDRMARNSTDAMNIQKKLADYGIRLFFLKERYYVDGQRATRMRFVFDSLTSEMYSEGNAALSRRARRREALSGGYCSPTPPFGYRRNGVGPLQIEPVQAARVREMYRLLLEGFSRNRIAQIFRQKRIPKNGGSTSWSVGEITNILRREANIGIRVFKGVVWDGKKNRTVHNPNRDEWMIIPHAHKPLVELDTFIRAQKLMDQRNKALNFNSVRKHQSLLGGMEILICGKCGGNYASHVIARKGGPEERYYFCGRRMRMQDCLNPGVRQAVVDQVVLGLIARYVNDPKKLRDRWREFRNAGIENLLPIRKRLKVLEAELADLETRKTRLVELIERPSSPAALSQRLLTLEQRSKALWLDHGDFARKVKAFDAGFDEERYLTQLRSFDRSTSKLPPESRKMLIKQLIRRVAIHAPDKFTVETSFLPKPETVQAQAVLVGG